MSTKSDALMEEMKAAGYKMIWRPKECYAQIVSLSEQLGKTPIKFSWSIPEMNEELFRLRNEYADSKPAPATPTATARSLPPTYQFPTDAVLSPPAPPSLPQAAELTGLDRVTAANRAQLDRHQLSRKVTVDPRLKGLEKVRAIFAAQRQKALAPKVSVNPALRGMDKVRAIFAAEAELAKQRSK